MALIFALFVVIEGHMHGANLAHIQPAKLASLEVNWVTQTEAPIYLIALPDESTAANSIEIGRIPGALSLLAFHSPHAQCDGSSRHPEGRPATRAHHVPRVPAHGRPRQLLLLIAIGAWLRRKRIESSPFLLKVLTVGHPPPLRRLSVGLDRCGGGKAAVDRLRAHEDNPRRLPRGRFPGGGLAGGFVVVYALIGITAFWLMAQAVRKGPGAVRSALRIV